MQADRFGGDWNRFAIQRTECSGPIEDVETIENGLRTCDEGAGMISRDERTIIGVRAIEECFGPDRYARRTG